MNITGIKNTTPDYAEDPAPRIIAEMETGDPQGCDHRLREVILETAVYEQVLDRNGEPVKGTYIGHFGDFYDVVKLVPDPNGRHSIKTADGDLRYEMWMWTYMPNGFVQVNLLTKRHGGGFSGNVQWVTVRTELLDHWLRASGLEGEFAVSGSRAKFIGDEDALRSFDVYPCCNKLTWGVYFKGRPNEHARWHDKWGGAHLPDEATARDWGQRWVGHRGRVLCANLHQLKGLYPDHPVVPLVEALERKERGHQA